MPKGELSPSPMPMAYLNKLQIRAWGLMRQMVAEARVFPLAANVSETGPQGPPVLDAREELRWEMCAK